MRWQNLVGLLIVSLGVAGCATSTPRDGVGGLGTRSTMWSKTTAPRQVQVAMPPDQDDPFAQAASKPEKRSLSRYFPGLSASPSSNLSLAKAEQSAASRPATISPKSNAVAGTTRPSWFGFRKPRATQTYMTDARSSSLRSTVEPSPLPVALQLPTNRLADKAVTPTSADVSDSEPNKVDAGAKPVPSNPDSSSAEASPLSTTEPQLAIPPIDAQDPKTKPGPEAQPSGSSDVVHDQPSETPAVDPRERPRMAANSPTTLSVPDSNPVAENADPAEPVASKPTESNPVEPSTARKEVKVALTGGDPSNSLGLPQATVPTSYIRHESVAVRGSYQAPQPPPVLASPQVVATPQSQKAAPTGEAKKTWRRPCLRRLIRRVGKLGEFANPPTALPH